MDQMWIDLIAAIVVAIVGFALGQFRERQYDVKVEDLYGKYRLIFSLSGEIIKSMDAKLYTEMEEAIQAMKTAYESPEFTTAMFNTIVKESKDVFDRVQTLLNARKG